MKLWQRVQNDIGILSPWMISDKFSFEENVDYSDENNLATIQSKRTSSAEPIMLVQSNDNYIRRYQKYLSNTDYSFRLKDDTILQAFYTFKDDILIKQKFAFYESLFTQSFVEPESDELEEMDSESELLPFEDSETSVLDKNDNPLFFHFDYDPSTKVNIIHPAAHLSLGKHKHCRVPVSSPLRFVDFLRMIVVNFYQEHYDSLSDYLKKHESHLKENTYENEITEDEDKFLHFFAP